MTMTMVTLEGTFEPSFASIHVYTKACLGYTDAPFGFNMYLILSPQVLNSIPSTRFVTPDGLLGLGASP